ncbi:hypothetical protein FOA43_001702 [Brettanomyces nanus]|uniref:Uncharacterized protein n=1 Tax=Eeniella nana TaxID=13502 RepID=A0A875S212_EENNA|nr:uncharacterized protein FOA43_001702 [Brettanomyces nanus]QPG74375.1 hypothetical protein FOA43_001702 [Brettanomyces nanus]
MFHRVLVTRPSAIRLLATSVSGTEQTLYSIKQQVDEYVYARSLPKKWKPIVYRQKNADLLTSLDVADSEGRPILPKKYPGIPSKRRFVHFINQLILPEELEAVKKTLSKVDRHAPDFLAPSMINALLYKSAEFGLFGEDLTFVYNLQNYRSQKIFGPRNIEAIILLRTLQAKQSGVTDLDWAYRKLHHIFKHNKATEKETALIKASQLCLFTQLLLNRAAENTTVSPKDEQILNNKIKKALESFSEKFVPYEVNAEKEILEPSNSFDKWQHAYAILKLLQSNVSSLPEKSQSQFQKMTTDISPFLEHVEELGKAANKVTLLEILISKAKFSTEVSEGAKEAEEAKEAEAQ